MKRIFKIQLQQTNSIQRVAIQKDFKFLKFDFQYGRPVIWVEVEENVRLEEFNFMIKPTGAQVSDIEKYLGTVMQLEGALVWHLYQEVV